MNIKFQIKGKITSIGKGYVNRDGKVVRPINVACEGEKITNFYQLTEVTENPRSLITGQVYQFIGFVNGINYFNSMLISSIKTTLK